MDPCVSICSSSALSAFLFLIAFSTNGSNGEVPAPGVVTLFGDKKPPVTADPNDRSPVELGLKFRTSEPGKVIGIRFYRAVNDPNGHKVNLWTAKGRRLATASLKATQAPAEGWPHEGWIEVKFPSPVSISAGETYIASYHTSVGQYPTEEGGMASGVTNGPLTALAGGTNGGNGVFRYGKTSSLPVYSSQNTHFFVDVLFRPTPNRHVAGKSDKHHHSDKQKADESEKLEK